MEYTVREDENKTEWYLGDSLHKENGPAVVMADGTREWWFHGKRHCEDGPAITFPDGHNKWFIEGESISEEDFNAFIEAKNAPPEPIKQLKSTYTVDEVKDWLEDFSSVVISPKTGQIRWANTKTHFELWHLLQEIEDENNGLHAFVNDLTEGELENHEKSNSDESTAGFFTLVFIIASFVAVAVYLVNEFYRG
jgi:hypothetical protein